MPASQFVQLAGQACSKVVVSGNSPLPKDGKSALTIVTGTALATRSALDVIRSLPQLDAQPTGESQRQMVTDWDQWLANATAMRSRSFASSDTVLDAWDSASQPAYRAAEFFKELSISPCVQLFPSGE
jgi:hypothetical protein